MLYDPAAFEPLTDEEWSEGRARDGIAALVADADATFEPAGLWPAHEWDGWKAPQPPKNLYVGAAGVVFALDQLRRRGLAETRTSATRPRTSCGGRPGRSSPLRRWAGTTSPANRPTRSRPAATRTACGRSACGARVSAGSGRCTGLPATCARS